MHMQDGAVPTGPADPTDLARRISLLLQPALDCRVDVPLMLRDALYARDVLLVCEAHRGTELAALALQYREALAPPRKRPGLEPRTQARPVPRTVGPAPAVPRPQHQQLTAQAPARGEGDSTIARAMRQRAGTPTASTPSDRNTTGAQTSLPPPRDSGLSSFFDRFRSSAPAPLGPLRAGTRPVTLGPDGPDTWPPEADGPLEDALRAPSPLPPGSPAQQEQPLTAGKGQPGKRWLSPSRWFSRGEG